MYKRERLGGEIFTYGEEYLRKSNSCHRIHHETLKHYGEYLHEYFGLRFSSWKYVDKHEHQDHVTIMLDESSPSCAEESLLLASLFDERDHVEIIFSD
jgi:hypothetical protein